MIDSEEFYSESDMNKKEIITHLAKETGLEEDQVEKVLEGLMELAYQNTNQNGFLVPGLGRLVLVDRPDQSFKNPQTGEVCHLPGSKMVKFRLLTAVTDHIIRLQK